MTGRRAAGLSSGRRPIVRALAALLLCGCLSGCQWYWAGPTFLDPAGPVAHQDRHYLFIVIGMLSLVVGPVFLTTPFFAWYYRLGNKRAKYTPKWDFYWPLEFLIWGTPVLVVLVLSVFNWKYTHELDPYKTIPSARPPLRVQAVALNWKWLFIYPDQNIATVNELVFPVDRSVRIEMTSDTVMQSLLVPQLAGQLYAMGGMRTILNLKADRTGTFSGENTQYNGDGFEAQKFPVFALTPAHFDRWVAQVKAQPMALTQDRYRNQVASEWVPKHPLVFSSVDPGLFKTVLDHYYPGVRAAPGRQMDISHGD